MPIRAGMTDLVALVQLLIADPSATQFTPEQVQAALDRRRKAVYRELLQEAISYSSGGGASYLDYYSQYGTWEDSILLQSGTYATLTPATKELLARAAHWTFATSTFPPVYATGNVYDIYAACADLCEAWASATMLAFDFSADRQSFSRSQITQALTARAKEFRRKAWVGTASMTRDDVNPRQQEATGTAGEPIPARRSLGPLLDNTPNLYGN